jgi:UDP-N-acetyl-alpha-D-muramoyl-L-alanyl-L-glutamate epimerase
MGDAERRADTANGRTMSAPRSQANRFRYGGFDMDVRTGELACNYLVDDRPFVEHMQLGDAGAWGSPAAEEASRLVYLLAGVSYFKTAAPPLIEVDIALREIEQELLADFYRQGLAEFAYRNDLDLSDLQIRARQSHTPNAAFRPLGDAPLVPFGGGIDSIVTVELVKRRHADASVFVVNPGTGSFEAIERVIPVTGLAASQITRSIDPQLLDPEENDFLVGHVPATGIVSALGILTAVGHGHSALVLSNEWSASAANLVVRGQPVNHQYSKSRAFETAFAAAVADSVGASLRAFSMLRPYTELWIARQFAGLGEYHPVFHSCNRAFAIDPTRRLDHWCGECDKCCFIDLILAPFLARTELEMIFGGEEPLSSPALLEQFAVLVGLSENPKPFECVGDVGECGAALQLAAGRSDRRDTEILQRLADKLPPLSDAQIEELFAPHGPHDIPHDFAPEDLLV